MCASVQCVCVSMCPLCPIVCQLELSCEQLVNQLGTCEHCEATIRVRVRVKSDRKVTFLINRFKSGALRLMVYLASKYNLSTLECQ